LMWLFQTCIAVLHPQNPHHFAWQPSAPVSQSLWSSYLSHKMATTI
jgi:hypothetical protein